MTETRLSATVTLTQRQLVLLLCALDSEADEARRKIADHEAGYGPINTTAEWWQERLDDVVELHEVLLSCATVTLAP